MRVDPGATTRADGTVDALRRGRIAAAGPERELQTGLTDKQPYRRRRAPAVADPTYVPSACASRPAVTMAGGA